MQRFFDREILRNAYKVENSDPYAEVFSKFKEFWIIFWLFCLPGILLYRKLNWTIFSPTSVSSICLRSGYCVISSFFSQYHLSLFIRCRNSLAGDTISGHWATVGVLIEKGTSKLTSSGKNFCVWKMGSLSETVLSVFLFGDAFKSNSEEPAGTVFAFFNSSVRKDVSDLIPLKPNRKKFNFFNALQGSGISLSIFSAGQVLKLGISVDFGICCGKRKDGMPCTMFINKYVIIIRTIRWVL